MIVPFRNTSFISKWIIVLRWILILNCRVVPIWKSQLPWKSEKESEPTLLLHATHSLTFSHHVLSLYILSFFLWLLFLFVFYYSFHRNIAFLFIRFSPLLHWIRALTVKIQKLGQIQSVCELQQNEIILGRVFAVITLERKPAFNVLASVYALL